LPISIQNPWLLLNPPSTINNFHITLHFPLIHKTLTPSDLVTYTNWMNLVVYNNLMEFFLYTCKFMYEIYACLHVYRYVYMCSCASRKSCKSLKLNVTSHIACLLCIYYIHCKEWFSLFKVHIVHIGNYIFTSNLKLISISTNFRLTSLNYYNYNNSLFYLRKKCTLFTMKNVRKPEKASAALFHIPDWCNMNKIFYEDAECVRLDIRFQASSSLCIF
jgi:hypothetical protein